MFNYQIVFKVKDSSEFNHRVIFAGETDVKLVDVLASCVNNLNYTDKVSLSIESVVYQPVNSSDYGSQKTS